MPQPIQIPQELIKLYENWMLNPVIGRPDVSREAQRILRSLSEEETIEIVNSSSLTFLNFLLSTGMQGRLWWICMRRKMQLEGDRTYGRAY